MVGWEDSRFLLSTHITSHWLSFSLSSHGIGSTYHWAVSVSFAPTPEVQTRKGVGLEESTLRSTCHPVSQMPWNTLALELRDKIWFEFHVLYPIYPSDKRFTGARVLETKDHPIAAQACSSGTP
jgi:hypothetical protein